MGNKLTLRQLPMEAIVWICGLLYLALSTPSGAWSVCPLHNLGFDICPGCGLGRSVSLLFHGEWAAAWAMNPMGYAALPMLVYRSTTLIRNSIINNNTTTYGKSTRPVTGN